MHGHLETMLTQHRELRALADMYHGELDRPVPDLAALGKCRWTLARLLSAHLAFEATHLYPALQRIGAGATGQRFASETGHMADALGQHVRDWTVASIETDWNGYRRATKKVVNRMCARMDVEERELHVLLRGARAA